MKGREMVSAKTMNQTAADFYRKQILEGLKTLPRESVDLFKRMYAVDERGYTAQDATERDIESVVAKMPDEKLDWALSQVEATCKKSR
jgi:hypothetical protein